MGTVEPQTDGGGGDSGSQGRHAGGGGAVRTDIGAVRTGREMKTGFNYISPTAGEG